MRPNGSNVHKSPHHSRKLSNRSINKTRHTNNNNKKSHIYRSFSTTKTSKKMSNGSTKHKASGVDFEFALPPTPHPNYKVVIGLETHAQILSKTKMFSSASSAFKSNPNHNVSLFDAAIPGTLPRVNEHCVEQVIKTGLALGGKVNKTSFFHRKQYFYCDMPSGYQITQNNPVIKGGSLSLDSLLPPGQSHKVGISHIQLEHDSAKSIHDINNYQTYVDLNRSGVALMEIVTTPTIYSAHEAVIYLKKLQSLLRFLGTSNANLEEGSMRCDVNITVQRQNPPGEMSQRVEIKNMNSFKHILYAIQSEAIRQISILEKEYENDINMKSSQSSIQRETRGYDHKTDSTHRLRSKENLLDYRFVPEPDLPPLIISPAYVQKVKNNLPILPDDRHRYLTSILQLSQKQSNVILGEDGAFEYFTNIILSPKNTSTNNTDGKKNIPSLQSWYKQFYQTSTTQPTEFESDITINRSPTVAYNWLTTELFGRIKRHRESNTSGSTLRHAPLLETNDISPKHLATLIDMIDEQIVSGKQAKKLLDFLFQHIKNQQDDEYNDDNDEECVVDPSIHVDDINLSELAQKTGNFMDSNPERINQLINTVISIYPDEVEQFIKHDKKQFSAFLTGQVIKLSSTQENSGEIDPRLASEMLSKHLSMLKNASN